MRNHPDWLEAYLEYTTDTESKRELHLWSGLSALAAALQRKVKFRIGRVTTWPGMYIFLVGPPASRKGVAIHEVTRILDAIKTIKTSPDSMSRESLLDNMALAEQTNSMYGKPFTHCSLTAVISELKSFTGTKKENERMINFLTDIFDCPRPDWSQTNRHNPGAFIAEPHLNFLAATTPNDLGNILPVGAIGGGFTSRIIFVYVDGPRAKIPVPEWGEKEQALCITLTADLQQIAKIDGEFQFDPEALEYYSDWYTNRSNIYLCTDPVFDYWYARKQIFVMKVSMLLAVSRGETKYVRIQDVKRAMGYIEAVEKQMHNCFATVGNSGVTDKSKLILDIVKSRGPLSEMDLRKITYKDLGDDKIFESVVSYLVKAGMIYKIETNPAAGSRGITYSYGGKKNGK